MINLVVVLAIIAFTIHTLTIFIDSSQFMVGILFTIGMIFILIYFVDPLYILKYRIFKNRSKFLVYYIKVIGIAIIVYYIYYFLVENRLF